MRRENTCCFTGPRPERLPQNGNEFSAEIVALKAAIRTAVLSAYEDGYRFFMSGMAEGFDLLAADAVLELKADCPGMGLIAALPYKGAPLRHSPEICEHIGEILDRADIIYSLFDEHIPGCELSRNKFMVDHSSRIIGYYNGLSNGTAHCWGCALESGLETVNLYESNIGL